MRQIGDCFMFNFGGPEQTARLLWESAIRGGGPGLPEIPMDEMTHDQLESAVVYARIALNNCILEKLGPDVLEICCQRFGEVMGFLSVHDQDFARSVLDHKIDFPTRPKAYWAKFVRDARSES